MTHLDLFSGSGIGILAAHEAGIETLAWCESDPWCRFALERLWPEAEAFHDITAIQESDLVPLGPINIVAGGCFILDGTQALAYARSRHYEELREGEWHEDPTSDLGRSKRQRAFVNACLQTALAQVKTNPFNTGSLVEAMGAAIRIDDQLDPIGAATSLRTAVGDGLQSYALPVVGKTIDGNAVLILDNGADTVLDYFRGIGPAPAPAA